MPIADDSIHLWVGGGVVWDSDPEAEIEESWVKARPLLAAVGGLVRCMTLLAVAIAGRGLVDPEEPVFRADDDALLRGGAAFETIRVYGGRPFLARRALAALRGFRRASASGDRTGSRSSSRSWSAPPRPTCAAAVPDLGALVATAAAVPPGLDELRGRGLTLASFEVGAPPPLLGGAKSTSYDVSFAARRDAERAGADDALLVGAGCVLEAATANVWWRRGDELYTPALRAGVLPGVTRAFVRSRDRCAGGRASRSQSCSRQTRRS